MGTPFAELTAAMVMVSGKQGLQEVQRSFEPAKAGSPSRLRIRVVAVKTGKIEEETTTEEVVIEVRIRPSKKTLPKPKQN